MANREIEFVSYSGRYPNLCRGRLIIRVNGEQVDIDSGIISGGSIWFDGDWDEHIVYGPWVFSDPGFNKHECEVITDLMNKNVPYGCCGGCI